MSSTLQSALTAVLDEVRSDQSGCHRSRTTIIVLTAESSLLDALKADHDRPIAGWPFPQADIASHPEWA